MAALPSEKDVTGWTVIPDLAVLRAEYRATMGREAGNRATDQLSAKGWRVVFDLRLDGCPDGFVCEMDRADGSVVSVVWSASQVRSFHAPKTQTTET